MKRISQILGAGALLALLLNHLPATASAAIDQMDMVQLTMAAETPTVEHGSKVVVTIQADRDHTNQGMGITLYYDKSVLKPIPEKCSVSEQLQIHGPLEIYDTETQRIRTALRISCFPREDTLTYSGNMPLATLTFQTIGAAPEGTKIQMAAAQQYKESLPYRLPQPLGVTVTPISVTGVSLDKTSLELEVGHKATLTPIVEPQGATNQSVIWTSSNEAIVTVRDGNLEAVAVGDAVIRAASAEDDSKYAECAVAVKAPNNAGYTVTIPEEKVAEIGGEVRISPAISHPAEKKYNAFTMTFSYDPSKLTLDTEKTVLNTDGITLNEEKVSADRHRVKLVRYGEDVSFVENKSKPFELVFTAAQVHGETSVTLEEARVDLSSNALLKNAAIADVKSDSTAVVIAGYPVIYPQGNLYDGPAYVAAGSDMKFSSKAEHFQYCFAGAKMNGQIQKIWYEFLDSEGKTIERETINTQDGYVHSNSEIKDVVIHFGGADKTDESGLYVYHGEGGTFIIPEINGPVDISGTDHGGRYYKVTKQGSAAGSFQGSDEARYGEDYVLTQKENGNFTMSIQGLDKEASFTGAINIVTGIKTYTLDGDFITSDFTVRINGQTSGEEPDGSDDPDDPGDPGDSDDPAGDFTVTARGEGILLLGGSTAREGQPYPFRLEDDAVYVYSWKVTIGGVNRTSEVTYDEDEDIYTIPGNLVDGNILIEIVGNRKGEEFTVTVSGTGKSDVDAEKKATYGKNYVFELDEQSGYIYTVAIVIDGEEYNDYEEDDGIYTIPGGDIRGDITIKVTRTKKSSTTSSSTTTSGTTTSGTTSTNKTTSTSKKTVTVTFAGSGAEDADGKTTATQSQAYTFRIHAKPGFAYRATATVAGKAVACTYSAEKGEYTIAAKDVNGNLVITIEKTRSVETSVYITLDGKCIFLVAYFGEVEKGQVPQYDGNDMYWSDAYNAYVWLVSSNGSDEMIQTMAEQKITFGRNNVVKVDYSGNVDRSLTMDMPDARLILDMYRGVYDLDTMEMQKMLAADVTADKKVNVRDALSISARVLQQEEGGSVSE